MAAIGRPRGAGGDRSQAPRYKRKTKRVRPSRQGRVIAKWEREGWELERGVPFKRRIDLAFRKQKPPPRWAPWAAIGCVLAILAAALVVAIIQPPDNRDPYVKVRREAAAAIKDLRADNLPALDKELAAHRGQPDFAYFFTSQTTPRTLGDALASVAGTSANAPFKDGVDTRAYDLELTDLAGTVALATHGTGAWALPASWTTDFIEATTAPATLYPADADALDTSSKQRVDQDMANEQNLLLLLSRGYWSTDFLEAVTSAYWSFDHANGEDGWHNSTLADAEYAPAPSGDYLTDGIVALTAALTANPAASHWAFADFQPSTVAIDGTDQTVGAFTHFLFFDHHFPVSANSDGASVGMTASVTALAAAETADDPSEFQGKSAEDADGGAGAAADAVVLHNLAEAAKDQGGGSKLSKVWKATKHIVLHVVQAVLDLVKRWGHPVLDVLTLLPVVQPELLPVGIVAAITNSGWYAVDGDWSQAALSLATAVPGLALPKIAKSVAAAAGAEEGAAAVGNAERAAEESGVIAKIAKLWRPKAWLDCDAAAAASGLSLRFNPDWTPEQRAAAVQKVKAIMEAAQRGELKKTAVVRSGTSATSRYTKNGGEVAEDEDVDHIIELQLGGRDDISNMKPLDKTVNRSLGKQIQVQLAALTVGDPVTHVAICDR